MIGQRNPVNGRFVPGPARDFEERDWKERYWEHVDKRGPDECWPWKGSLKGGSGYGNFSLNGKPQRPSRVAFLIEHRRWPNPHALHTCDNPPCQNPRHLFEGDQFDNMRDAAAKGRFSRRENGNAKVNWEIVNRIRLERKTLGKTQKELSQVYGVSQATVWLILQNRTWKPEKRQYL